MPKPMAEVNTDIFSLSPFRTMHVAQTNPLRQPGADPNGVQAENGTISPPGQGALQAAGAGAAVSPSNRQHNVPARPPKLAETLLSERDDTYELFERDGSSCVTLFTSYRV